MYRLKSNFNGTWAVETEVEKTYYFNDPSEIDSNGYYRSKTKIVKEWHGEPFARKLTYAEAKKELEQRIARDAFVPVILVPPLPDRDPTLPPRKRFLGIF